MQVVEALRPHGLTLQNFASIREQAIGGFIQVGAHGTGASIPPVDEQVVAMKLVTPARGTLQLSEVTAQQSCCNQCPRAQYVNQVTDIKSVFDGRSVISRQAQVALKGAYGSQYWINLQAEGRTEARVWRSFHNQI